MITTTAAFKGYSFSSVYLFIFCHDGSGEEMCARPTRTDGTAIILLFLPDFRKPARRLAARPTVGGRARGVRWPRLIRSHHRRTPANGVEVRNGRSRQRPIAVDCRRRCMSSRRW